MKIQIELSPEQVEALDFLRSLRNMHEYEDSEQFVRAHVGVLINAALSEKRVKDRNDLLDAMEKLTVQDIEKFVLSRTLVK